MTKRTSNQRILAARSADDLARLTAEFEREHVADEFGPLSPTGRRRWAAARTKGGRPRKGAGAKIISISVEKALLARSDALAHRMGVTRADLIERSLKAMLVAQGEA